MSDILKINRNGQILEIILDRPKANTLDAPSSRKMGRVFANFRDDPNLRVAILTVAGEKFFCAAWDLKVVAGGEEYFGDHGSGTLNGETNL
jgi:crotonobetainyl-CoA hydratase